MPATTHGYYLQRGAVRCQIDSLIPFTLRFSRDGRRLGVDQLFRWGGPYRGPVQGPPLNSCPSCFIERHIIDFPQGEKTCWSHSNYVHSSSLWYTHVIHVQFNILSITEEYFPNMWSVRTAFVHQLHWSSYFPCGNKLHRGLMVEGVSDYDFTRWRDEVVLKH